MISVTFPDGAQRQFPPGVTGLDIAKGISPSLAKRTVAMALDGQLADLADPIQRDAKIEFVSREDPRALELIRHDCAHVLAEAAVERVQSDTRARMLRATDPYLRERLHDLDDLGNRLSDASAKAARLAYRLSTIAAHTELGSGMAVAMKDLEIRGAGNLLGGEQSGHIAEVGFDLYIRLVSEAVSQVRDETTVDDFDVRVELPVDAHIPHSYVPEERLRLEAYRRLADAHNDSAVDDVQAELVDRDGPLPASVAELIAVANCSRTFRRLAG